MLRFSVVIPAYNSEEFLSRCLNSILKQNYKDYEIIVVNDGSKDETKNILDIFEERHPSIKIIHKENGGVSEARNVGLDNASGEYILFIDADDYIIDGYFEYINNCIKKFNPDSIILNHFLGNKETINLQKSKTTILNDKLICQSETIDRFVKGEITNSPWDKVFKKEKINNIRFPLGMTVGEDAVFFVKYFLNCDNILQINKAFYVYMQDTNGITKTAFTEKKLVDITKAMKIIKELLKNKTSNKDISLMIYNQILAYIFNIKIKSLLSSNEANFFLEHIKLLTIIDISGFKKKIAFLLLYIYNRFKF
jgi:glycosyltransferase involved in cell wall biosynthesis